jgi:hypothetical protein
VGKGVADIDELDTLIDAAEVGALSDAQWARVRELDLEREFRSLKGPRR